MPKYADEYHNVVDINLKVNVSSDKPLTSKDKQELIKWAIAELESNADYGTDFDFSIGKIVVQ